MKKIILPIILCVALALAPVAQAVSMPTIGITAVPIDYVYAQAGIAQPVSKSYVQNERYALLVTVTIPNYMDIAGMECQIIPSGCTVETGTVPVEPGSYILTGTVVSPSASVAINFNDMRISQAGTAQDLWNALYGDRSVSVKVPLAYGGGTVPTINGSISLPQTGSPVSIIAGCLCIVGASGILCAKVRRNRK